MEDGKLIEAGPHARLVDQGGRYAAMWAKQAEAGAAA